MATATDEESALPLEGLYLHLVRAGFPVSVRDYQAALSALKRGHGVGGRDRLLWLATTLWARGDFEIARLESLFRQFPLPTAERVRSLTGMPEPAPTPADSEPKAALAEGGSTGDAESSSEGLPQVGFGGPRVTGGGLPSLQHRHRPARHYVLEPRPLISQRSLTIAWRRFRRPQRSGPKTELDLDATIAERCRNGWLLEPVLIPARRNRARLVVLVDASSSMVPWRRMNRVVAASLPGSMLGHARLLYFDNDPREGLYETDALTGSVSLEATLRQEIDCAALLIGDAGAARGRNDRDRARGTRDFVRQANETWNAMAWLNPMPRPRWRNTSAGHLASDRRCPMFEFTEEGLIRGVDALRGIRGR